MYIQLQAEVALGPFVIRVGAIMELAFEIVRGVVGFALASTAIALLIVTIRVTFKNSSAYEANRLLTHSNPIQTFKGEMNWAEDKHNRLSHGLAMDLKTGRLRHQHRLSSEAIDEVLAR